MDENAIPIGSYLHEGIERSRRAEERAGRARRRLAEAQHEAETAARELRDAHDHLRGLFKWLAEPAEEGVSS